MISSDSTNIRLDGTDTLVVLCMYVYMYTHTHPFNGPFSGTTQVSRYQKGTTNLDFTEARESKWQWHQLGHMHVCTSLQTDNHASNTRLCFLQAGCPSCHPTNSVKALRACMYVCMYVIFIRCNRRTSNNKHKKQSQNNVQYKTEKPKTILFDRVIQMIIKDFL